MVSWFVFGWFVRFPFDQKFQVAAEYTKAKSENDGARPNIASLARRCRASRTCVRKVEHELAYYGHVINP